MTDQGLVYKILRDTLHNKSANSPMEKSLKGHFKKKKKGYPNNQKREKTLNLIHHPENVNLSRGEITTTTHNFINGNKLYPMWN